MPVVRTSKIVGKNVERSAKTDFSPSESSYSVSEAAQELGVSPPTVRRMVQDGDLRSFRTPGGHIRVPSSSIEKFRAGADDELDPVDPPSSVLQSRRERIEELSLEAEELRAKRQLDQIRRDQAAEESERADAEDARNRRAQRERDSAAVELRRMERQQERERAQTERERIQREFFARWLRFGNDLLLRPDYRWLSASQRKTVVDAVEDESGNRDVDDEERMKEIVTQVVMVTIEPWERIRKAKERREQIVRQSGLCPCRETRLLRKRPGNGRCE